MISPLDSPAMSTLPLPPSRPSMTPLRREDLLDPGVVFPRDELRRRILSFFWRDCCEPACFSRAPAPVIEYAAEAGTPRRVRAWWLLDTAIIEEPAGPHAERLRPFFAPLGRNGQLWPRYEFRILPEPFEVEMGFHREPLSHQEHRTRLALEAGERVRVSWHETARARDRGQPPLGGGPHLL